MADETMNISSGRVALFVLSSLSVVEIFCRHCRDMNSSEMDSESSSSAARKVLKKIDRVIIPLLFVTYMLNFMDKTVLSSAAVFGLRDDNVSETIQLRRCFR
jgi:hypothetical protein